MDTSLSTFIDDFIISPVQEGKLSVHTISAYVRTLKVFGVWLQNEGYLKSKTYKIGLRGGIDKRLHACYLGNVHSNVTNNVTTNQPASFALRAAPTSDESSGIDC